MRKHRLAWLAAFLFCAGLFLFRLHTAAQNPITWDEPVYLNASKAYANWGKLVFSEWSQGRLIQPFSAENINRYWQRHLPSPPLAKIINGMGWVLLGSRLGDLAALRSGSAFCYAVLFALLIWHAQRMSGWFAAAVSTLVLIMNPRLFSHAGTANLDTIGMGLAYLSLFFFWITAGRRGWKITLAAGVLWGLAFAAKNSALLVLPVMLLWTVFWVRRPALLGRLAAMQIIGAIVFFAVWPWLYHDTGAHLNEFTQWAGLKGVWQKYTAPLTGASLPAEIDRKLSREFGASSTGILIDGKRQFPWHYSLDVLLTVVPLPGLILFALGTLFILYRIRSPESGFLLLGMWIPVLLTSLPNTPVYDMERFLLVCFPFLALTAGTGAASAASRIRHTPVLVAIFIILLLSYVQTIREWRYIHPLEFSYYNGLTGGLPGAVKRGFPPTYWLQGYGETLQFLNEAVPDGATIAAEEDAVLLAYQQYGLLKKSLVPMRMLQKVKSAQKIQFYLHQHPMKAEREAALKKVYTVYRHDVPIVSVFRITPRYLDYVKKQQRLKRAGRRP